MTEIPPLVLVEPTARQKQRRLAEVIQKGSVTYSQEEIRLCLREIRRAAVDNMADLAVRFRQSIADYSNAHIILANNAVEAVEYVTQVAHDTRTIAIGRSSTVSELQPGLENEGYTFIDTYAPQFVRGAESQKKIAYAWQLPAMLDQSTWDTFDHSRETEWQVASSRGVKDITALLGVNAACAEDGSVFFLQHSANIGDLLSQARRLILVIGLEKIVASGSDAFFQTKCAGAFGMESILLDLKTDDANQGVTEPLSQIAETHGLDRELHIVLLDNGRTEVAKGDYRELLQCIGCRACAKQCPGYRHLDEFTYYPREYLWSFLIGGNPSVELCTHCAMCLVECPVGINLSRLVAMAKAERSANIARSRASQVLLNMTRLAPVGSLGAPLVNWLSGRKLLRLLVERVAGIDRRRKSPPFHHTTFERWFGSRHA